MSRWMIPGVVGACLVLAAVLPPSRSSAAPSACRYATPASLLELLRESPVVVVGTVEDAGTVAVGPAYDVQVSRSLSGGAPATIRVTYDGGSCADLHPRFSAGEDYVVFLRPSFTITQHGGTATFRGSPHGAFLVDRDALRPTGVVTSPFTDAVAAGGMTALEAQLRDHEGTSRPWTALATPEMDLGGAVGVETKPDGANLAEVVRHYRRVLIAQVQSLTTRPSWSAPGSVESEARLLVVQRLRWNRGHADPFVSLGQPGGIVAGSTWESAALPLMRPGEYYLVFAGCGRACPGSPVLRLRNGILWAQSPAWLANPAVRALHGLPLAAAVAAINRALAEGKQSQ